MTAQRALFTVLLALILAGAVVLLILAYKEAIPGPAGYTPIKFVGTPAVTSATVRPAAAAPAPPAAPASAPKAPTAPRPPGARPSPEGSVVVISDYQARQAYLDARFLIERSRCFAEAADLRPPSFNTGLTGVKFVGPLTASRDFTEFSGAIVIQLRGEKYDVLFHDEIPVTADLQTGSVECLPPDYDLSSFGYAPPPYGPYGVY